jgi:UTP--glucose-1-phosphate uridylyltransferase
VVKLSGGLGASMGYKGPRGLIGVRSENTVLDLTVQQNEHLNKTYNTDVPLVLTNSTRMNIHKRCRNLMIIV